ncbi:hypothetical protein F4703DRAFT_1430601 [Phycomyces blakesleeanus]
MIATTRWILHFSVTPKHGPFDASSFTAGYTVTVYCFDLISLEWVGKVVEFTSTSDQVRLVSLSKNNLDTLIITPVWKNCPTKTHLPEPTNQEDCDMPKGVWKYDMSTESPRGTLTWLPLLSQNTKLDGGQVVRGTKNYHLTLYGGHVFGFGNVRVLDTANQNFLEIPFWWTSQTSASFGQTPTKAYFFPKRALDEDEAEKSKRNSNNNRRLAIILGSVLGFVGFAIFVGLVVFCLYRRHKQKVQTPSRDISSNIGQDPPLASPSLSPRFIPQPTENDTSEWASRLHDTLSNITQTSNASVEPGQLHASTSFGSMHVPELSPQPIQASRFTEHFDVPLSSTHGRSRILSNP